MTIVHRIILTKDVIKTTATGDIDVVASMKMLTKLTGAMESSGDYHVLVDVRQAQSAMSDDEILTLMQTLTAYENLFHNKIAVLHSGRRDDQIGLVTNASRDIGLQLAFFVDYEDAMNWLNTSVYFDIDYDGESLPDK